jgi:hypothetical protein
VLFFDLLERIFRKPLAIAFDDLGCDVMTFVAKIVDSRTKSEASKLVKRCDWRETVSALQPSEDCSAL